MPVGAFGGKRKIMEHIAPLGNVYQAGTLSGNPIAMIAGYTTLKALKDNPKTYLSLEAKTTYLREGIHEVLNKTKIPFVINQLGSMISVHFSDKPVVDFKAASECDIPLFNKLFHFMLTHGVYLPPSAYESWFLNDALSYNNLDKTIGLFKKFIKEI
jgi:glutamate-1-semialdehyde 2,1-aminomutase